MEKKFKRNCPKCDKEVYHSNVKNRNKAIKDKSICLDCSNKRFYDINKIKMQEKYLKFSEEKNNEIIEIFKKTGTKWQVFRKAVQPLLQRFKKEDFLNDNKRNCPDCNKEMTYSNKNSRNEAEKKKKLCLSCAKVGERNSFYGKKHKEESMKQMSKTKETSIPWKEFQERQQTDEFRQNISEKMSGENNPQWQRGTLLSIWTRKFGEEIAKQKNEEWLQKISKATSGENNPMYGKPSPNGAGNGWSGWYCDWFFRSIRELSYMINVIERFNLKWETGENKKYKVKYIDWEGKIRNYFPDFIIDNKYVVECKPKKLFNSANVQAKKNAAEPFFESMGIKYKLISPRRLNEEDMLELYLTEKIIFTEKYEQKFIEKYLPKEENL